MIKSRIIRLVAGSITLLMMFFPCQQAFSSATGVMIDLEKMLTNPDGDVTSLPPMPENLSAEEKTIYELYRKLLGRDPDGEGLETWLQHLRENGADSVRQGIEQSDEYLIGNMYRKLLGRNPDREGIEMWLEEIRKGNHTLASVQDSIMNSSEYQERQGADDTQSEDGQDEPAVTEEDENVVVAPEEATEPAEPVEDPQDSEEIEQPQSPAAPPTNFESMLAEMGIPNFLDRNTPNYDSSMRAGKELMKKSFFDATVFHPFISDYRKYIPILQRNLKREQEWYEKMVRENHTTPFMHLGDTIESAGRKVQEEQRKLQEAWNALKQLLQAADAEAARHQNNLAPAIRNLERLQENLAALGDPYDSSTATQRQAIAKSIKDLEKQIAEHNEKLEKHKILKAPFK